MESVVTPFPTFTTAPVVVLTWAEVVSATAMYGNAVLPVGAVTKAATIVSESEFAVPGKKERTALAEVCAVIVSPFATANSLVVTPFVFLIVKVSAFTAACEGTELRMPNPKDATAISAMRLKFVFVDIYFLSLVVTRNFLVAASR